MLLESNPDSATSPTSPAITPSGKFKTSAEAVSPKIDFRAHRAALALFVLLAAISVHDTLAVFKYPIAAGVNGYYYVLQVENLRTYGRPYFPKTTPAVLYALTGLSYLTRTIPAIKLGAVALHILLCVGLYLFVSECTRSKWIGLTAAIIVAVSGLHLYLIVEFVSNLGGAMLLVWSAWCWVKYRRQRKRIWAIGSLVLLSLALLSHRSVLPLASLLLTCAILQNWLLARERATAKQVVALSITFFLWVTPALLAAQRIIRLPQLLADEVTASPKLPLDRYAFPEEIILFVVSPLVLLLLFRRRSSQWDAAEVVLATVALFSLAVTLNPFFKTDYGWGGIAQRLRAFSYIEAAILAPGLIWLLLRIDRKELAAYTAAFVASMMVVSAALPWPNGMRTNYLERRQALIQSLSGVVPKVGPSPIIIAPHGDQFVVTAITGLVSQQRPPSELQYQTVYWLLSDVSDAALIDVSLVLFRNQYTAVILTEEATLRSRWDEMSSREKEKLLERNRDLVKILSLRSL